MLAVLNETGTLPNNEHQYFLLYDIPHFDEMATF